jgi:hypothetical protein
MKEEEIEVRERNGIDTQTRAGLPLGPVGPADWISISTKAAARRADQCH